MTGFGRGRSERDGYAWEVELRSENHRALRVAVNFAGAAPPWVEERVVGAVRRRLGRGAVRVQVGLALTGTGAGGLVNERLLGAYRRELERLGRANGIPGAVDWALLAGLPGVLQSGLPAGAGDREAAAAGLDEALEAALAALVESRRREGEALKAALAEQGRRLEALLERGRGLVDPLLADWRRRLGERLAALAREAGVNPEESGLAREVVLLAARGDVTEELERLGHHRERFNRALAQDGIRGRRLEFAAQEMQREANTMGAKSAWPELDEVVLELKLAVERIREQAANVE